MTMWLTKVDGKKKYPEYDQNIQYLLNGYPVSDNMETPKNHVLFSTSSRHIPHVKATSPYPPPIEALKNTVIGLLLFSLDAVMLTATD